MAKEMMIIFVYDTQFARNADEDPASSILYFHPNWVSDKQRTSLCGQIIGTAHCLKTMFKCPRILALQSGKFSICDYGRYILVVGTDRNIADWVLEYRTHILSSFITFFHKDLESMSKLYQSTDNFSTKLYYMFETYLKVLMYGGNMFSNIPSVQLPKSASNVFLEAIQILRSCQKIDHVLGGAILYHNKVVATQLSSNVTKRLVLTDPYRIKSPAETINYSFPLPIGVQLLRVYIEEEDYDYLFQDSNRLRSSHQYLTSKSLHKNAQTKSNSIKEPVLMTMKRDQSLIFTTVPEEGSENTSISTNNTKSQNRPKFLNLRSKTTDPKIDAKNEAKQVTSTPFCGNTSICSTPMTDLNKVLHQNALSICINPKDSKLFDKPLETDIDSSQQTDSLNSLLSAVSEVSDSHSRTQEKNSQNLKNTDQEVIDRLFTTQKSLSLCKLNAEDVIHSESPTSNKLGLVCKTITDPTFPVFKSNGMLISESLHNHYVCNGDIFQMDLNGIKENRQFDSGNEVWLSLKDFDASLEDSHDVSHAKNCNYSDLNETNKGISSEENRRFKNSRQTRRSLSLPLKSLSNDSNQNFSGLNKNCGIQLTPLLSKLSALAFEEKSSGFCSRDTTPSDYKVVKGSVKPNCYLLSTNKAVNAAKNNSGQGKLKTVVLFICGQQDMVINLLLDENACTAIDIVKNVWQTCIDCLGKLEKQIHHCLEMYPGGNCQNDNSEPYSYLCMNPHSDTIQKGGPWSGMELGALTHLHRDFITTTNLTEILLRDDDSIIYGHNYGKTEVFYHQTTTSNAGLPTPADPMSIVPLKAKRRLERDHAIILH